MSAAPVGKPRTVITLIVALDLDDVIGRAGGLPWHLPADLRRFRRLTLGKPVILGRRTHESIGRALPGRRNVVVSRQAGYHADGCEVVSSLEAALALVQGAPEVMILGGATLYEQALPRADRLQLTRVQGRFEGDVRFPAWDPAEWRETGRTEHPVDAENSHACTFIELERRL